MDKREPLKCNWCERPVVPIIHIPEGIDLCGGCLKKFDKSPEIVKIEVIKMLKKEAQNAR